MKYLIPVLAIFLINCSAVMDALKKNVEVSFDSVEVNNSSAAEVSFTAHFNINNKNSVGGKIDAYRYNLLVEGKEFLDGNVTDGFDCGANSVCKLALPITVNAAKLLKLFSSLTLKSEYEYELKLEVDVSVSGNSTTASTSYTDKLPGFKKALPF